MNTLIWEKTKDGEVMSDIYSRLVKERILFIKEEIEPEMATSICATLLFLDSQKLKKEISIYINCPGGIVHSGLWPIYDTLNYINSPIKTVVIGEAYSAASAILCAGTKGMRMAYPNANIMIHNLSAGVHGPAHEIEKSAERIKRSNDNIVKLYMKHTGQKEKAVRSALKEDTYFSAEEAIAWGLIDKIVTPKSFDVKIETKLDKSDKSE